MGIGKTPASFHAQGEELWFPLDDSAGKLLLSPQKRKRVCACRQQAGPPQLLGCCTATPKPLTKNHGTTKSMCARADSKLIVKRHEPPRATAVLHLVER